MTQPQPIIPVIRNHTSHVKQSLLTIRKTGDKWRESWWIWDPKQQKPSILSLFRQETLKNIMSLVSHPNISKHNIQQHLCCHMGS